MIKQYSPKRRLAGIACLVVLVCGAPFVLAADSGFRDKFDGKELKNEWRWNNPDPAITGEVDSANKEFVITASGSHNHWDFGALAPYLVMECPQGANWDFEATVEQLNNVGGEQGALVVMFEEKDCFYFGPYTGKVLKLERSGKKDLGQAPLASKKVLLKIEKRGSQYTFFSKYAEADDWQAVASSDEPDKNPFEIGFMWKSWSPDAEGKYAFSDVKVTSKK